MGSEHEGGEENANADFVRPVNGEIQRKSVSVKSDEVKALKQGFCSPDKMLFAKQRGEGRDVEESSVFKGELAYACLFSILQRGAVSKCAPPSALDHDDGLQSVHCVFFVFTLNL